MSMTKKDYESIANELWRAQPLAGYPTTALQTARQSWARSCEAVAVGLRGTNPLFDRSRFIAWCHEGRPKSKSELRAAARELAKITHNHVTAETTAKHAHEGGEFIHTHEEGAAINDLLIMGGYKYAA